MAIMKKKTKKKTKTKTSKKKSKTTRKKATIKTAKTNKPDIPEVKVPVGNNGQMGPTKPELIHGGLKVNDEGHVILMGAPVKYKDEYPEMLVRHMFGGHSFWSFAAICEPRVCRRTLGYWLEKFPEFLEAREIGRQGDLKFLEDISKAGMTGTLRRISEEKVVLDSAGQPLKDDAGNTITDKKYAQARYCPKTWSLLMKNRHNFAEKLDVKSKNYSATKKVVAEMTEAEIDQELSELAEWDRNQLLKEGTDGSGK